MEQPRDRARGLVRLPGQLRSISVCLPHTSVKVLVKEFQSQRVERVGDGAYLREDVDAGIVPGDHEGQDMVASLGLGWCGR